MTIDVPRYQWFCEGCKEWHTGDCISHGYFFPSDAKERREVLAE